MTDLDVLVRPATWVSTVGRARGACGELLRGDVDGVPVSVTCPVQGVATVEARVRSAAVWAVSGHVPAEVLAAAEAACAEVGGGALQVRLSFRSMVPGRVGAGAVDAARAAAVRAVDQAAGGVLGAAGVARLLARSGGMEAAFDHVAAVRPGDGVRVDGWQAPPRFALVVVDPVNDGAVPAAGPGLDVSAEFAELDRAAAAGDLGAVARVASRVAAREQERAACDVVGTLLDVAERMDALGVVRTPGVAGGRCGLLFAAADRARSQEAAVRVAGILAGRALVSSSTNPAG